MTTNETYHAEYDTAAQDAQTTTDGYVDLAGVTAEKSVVMTDEGILQITFDVASTRPEPVHVEIRDLIPESIHLDRVGFHPDYGRENWSIEHEHQVVFEATLDPHGDLQTVYAIKPDGPSDLSTVSTETSIVGTVDGEPAPATGVSEPAGAADVADPSSAQPSDAPDAAGDGIDEVVPQELPDRNGEGRIPPASDGADAADPVDEDERRDETGSPDTADGDGRSDGRSPDPDGENRTNSDGDLIAQLAAELAEGRASDEDLSVLGDHLSSVVEPESPGKNSFDARLQRAEHELNELSAYTDALSEFLDERGSGQEILDDLKDRTANVESRLETVAGEVESVDDRLETTTEEVGDLDDRLETAENRDERFADRLDAVEDRHGETADRLDGVTDRLNTIDVHIETLENDLSALRGSHDEAGDRLDRVEESVERLDAAEDARAEQRDSLTAEIDAMADDLEEVRRWHRDFGRLLEEFGTVGAEAVDDADAEKADHADTPTEGPSTTTADSAGAEADGSEPAADEPNGDAAEPNGGDD
jgi:predicted  nucleic acid-binding Zn-ribbon protein